MASLSLQRNRKPKVLDLGWYYNQVPRVKGSVLPATAVFQLRTHGDVEELAEGMLRIRPALVAVTPAVRTNLALDSESAGLKLDSPMVCETIAIVLESRSHLYAEGELLWGWWPLRNYLDISPDAPAPVRALQRCGLDVSAWDGALVPAGEADAEGNLAIAATGAVPLTLLSALSDIGGVAAYCAVEFHPCGQVDEPADTRTVLVSSAASAVGIVAGQLYKLKGCRVIGITSTTAKARKLLLSGYYHSVIAYKAEKIDERLDDLAPEGIDVFLDLVGANQLDAGLKHMKPRGKVLLMGQIGQLDRVVLGNVLPSKEHVRIHTLGLTVGGIRVEDFTDRFPAARADLLAMLQDGRLRSEETVISGKFETWAECVDRLHASAAFGRFVLAVEPEVIAEPEIAEVTVGTILGDSWAVSLEKVRAAELSAETEAAGVGTE